MMALMILFVSCTGNQTSNTSSSDSLTIEAQQGVVLDTITHHLHKEIVEGRETPSYDILFRVLAAKGDDEASRQFNSTLTKAFWGRDDIPLDSVIHTQADSLSRAFESELKEFYDFTGGDNFSSQYTYEIQSSVAEDSYPGLSAYRIVLSSYLGGAHGSYEEYCVNVNNLTGRAIHYSDFFRDESLPQVKKLIQESLMKKNGCTSMDQLVEKTSICALGEVYVRDNNFLLLADSVEFLYNPYEIAPWACGLVTARVAYSDLNSCIVPDALPQK